MPQQVRLQVQTTPNPNFRRVDASVARAASPEGPRLLTFSDEPLAVILNEFNRHNPVTLRLDDPALQELRLSARFRSDNVAGFLRLLEAEFGIRAAAQGPGEILLRAAR